MPVPAIDPIQLMYIDVIRLGVALLFAVVLAPHVVERFGTRRK
jgi:hypothetical protein